MGANRDIQENTQQFILFGAGGAGRRALHRLGEEKVYAFSDNYKVGEMIEGKPVISIDLLKKLMEKKKYKVVICAENPEIVCEIAQQLQEYGIACELYEECKSQEEWELIHIVGDEIVYYQGTEFLSYRKEAWYSLYKQMLANFQSEFTDRQIDFWIYVGDKVEIAYWAVKLQIVNARRIFAFATKQGMRGG